MGSLTRWTNPTLPPLLQYAVFLCYLEAGFLLLFPNDRRSWEVIIAGTLGASFRFLVVGLVVGHVAAGLGLANERRWGWQVAVATTGAAIGLLLWAVVDSGFRLLGDPDWLFTMLFPAARFALVVHPQSREHQRIWFS